MFEMQVGTTKLEPIGLGVTKVVEGEEERLVLAFKTDKGLKDVQSIFAALSSTDTITLKNEKNELAYTGFTSLDSEAKIKVNEDETYSYELILRKPSAYDIALQAQADVAYLAATQNVAL